MNPLYAEAQNTVQGMWVMGIMTVVFLAFFTGWVLWAYNPGRKAMMDKAANMPFDDGGES